MTRKAASGIVLALLLIASWAQAAERPFQFNCDTFAFANMTVFEYQNGIPHLRRGEEAKRERYTRRCFVMSRTAMQFHKFARFDSKASPVDDRQLSARIRQVTRRAAWKPALPDNERVVFPGYSDLRDLSKARGRLLQETIGHGWPTYWRPGNYRMIFALSHAYQERTHRELNSTLARGGLFVAYLTTLPVRLSINHAVLVYARQPATPDGRDRYLVYDSNHPEAPRNLSWSDTDRSFAYEKDWDFIGGNVHVYQVYGKPLQ